MSIETRVDAPWPYRFRRSSRSGSGNGPAPIAGDAQRPTDRDVAAVDRFVPSSPLETESYLLGEPGTIVRFTNPDGPETVELPLDDGVEVVVARSGPREIPTQERLENAAVESRFFHPAQYLGDESIQDERVVVWVLLEVPVGEVPLAPGRTSAVTRASLSLSGY